MSDEPQVFFFKGKVIDTNGTRWVTRNPKEGEDVSEYPVLGATTVLEAIDIATSNGDDRIPLLQEQVHAEFQDAVLTAIKAADRPWQLMSQDEQDELIQRMDRIASHMLQQIIPVLVNYEFPVCRGTLDSVNVKKEIKATVLIDKLAPDRFDIIDGVGDQVLIAIADRRAFEGEPGQVKSDPNQRTFAFDAETGDTAEPGTVDGFVVRGLELGDDEGVVTITYEEESPEDGVEPATRRINIALGDEAMAAMYGLSFRRNGEGQLVYKIPAGEEFTFPAPKPKTDDDPADD